MRFAVVDYGVGNLFSLRKALSRQGVRTFLSEGGRGIGDADAVVLPGVGGFGTASRMLPREAILDYADSGRPVFGICLGMQLLLDDSEEGAGPGLGVVKGTARKLPRGVKVPQIGWNTIRVERESPVTEGLGEESWVYFVHSYYCETAGDFVLAKSNYGVEYPAVLQRRNFIGVQFHPEKSGPTGAKILQNMVRLAGT